jgi:hypothetical protein
MPRWMTREGHLLLIICGLGLAACGSSGDGGPSGPTATCTANTITLAGEVDGQPVDASLFETSFLFQQVAKPYTCDVGYDGGMMHLEWNTVFPIDGPAASVTGTIVMPAGAPHATESLCAGSGNIREHDEDGTGFHTDQIFTLGTLSVGPTCPGTAVAGTINGCTGG